jgi:hypothetical protein
VGRKDTLEPPCPRPGGVSLPILTAWAVSCRSEPMSLRAGPSDDGPAVNGP